MTIEQLSEDYRNIYLWKKSRVLITNIYKFCAFTTQFWYLIYYDIFYQTCRSEPQQKNIESNDFNSKIFLSKNV